MRKRLLAWLLVMAILTGWVFPVSAFADAGEDYDGPTSVYEEAFYINPLYADVVTEADLVQPEEAEASDASLLEEDIWYSDINSTAEVILDGMKDRETTIKICYHTTDSDAYGLGTSIVETALAHTGNPVEGDYLRWQYAGYGWNLRTAQSGDEYYFTYIYTMTYYTTAEQEVELDSAVSALLTELNVSNATDYQKVQAVYSYIAGNISYDYTNLPDENYKLKYTAYAALVNKTAVCQGYSCLLYRLLLELGVDCRLITGYAGGAHAWNIIGLNGLYYYADSTWDSSFYPRTGKTVYFLKGAGSYFDQGSSEQIKVPVMNSNSYLLVTPTAHTADQEYTTEAFSAAYPMATEDYDPSTVHAHAYIANVTEPTCMEQGYTTYTCECGDSYVGSNTVALGHSFINYVYNNDAKVGKDGTETAVCARGCGATDTRTKAGTALEEVTIEIKAQPLNVSAKDGDTAKFTVTATGSGLKYQWQYSKDSGKTWYNSPATGNTTNTVSISVAASKNGYLYRCVITGSNGKTATSDAAMLTVTPTGPTITKQPTDASAKAGDTAKFTVTASGSGLKYQWQYSKDSGKNWYNATATGNTTATVSVSVLTSRNGYLYRCVITDSNKKNVTSSAAKLIVLPAITKQPVDVSGKAGDTAKFTVTASGSGLKYQWQYSKDSGKNWYTSPAAGNTTSAVSISVATNKNGYLYRCVITDSNGKSVTSNAAKLIVLPIITKQPVNTTAKAGVTAKFIVTATGSGLKYQWQYSRDNGKTWYNSPAAGNTTAAVSISVTTSKNNYLYRCVITDSNGKSITSNGAKLTVVQ